MNELMTRLKTLHCKCHQLTSNWLQQEKKKKAKLKTNTVGINVTENVPDNRSRGVCMKFMMYYY